MHVIQLAPTHTKYHRATPIHQSRERGLGAVRAAPYLPGKFLDLFINNYGPHSVEGFHALENGPNVTAGHDQVLQLLTLSM